MPNLPEDILDRIRALEREVHRLTTYVNSKPGGAAGTVAAGPRAVPDASAVRETAAAPKAPGTPEGAEDGAPGAERPLREP